jgi:hypothetical protein
VAIEERKDPIIEQIRRRDRGLAIIELGGKPPCCRCPPDSTRPLRVVAGNSFKTDPIEGSPEDERCTRLLS